MNRFKQKPDRGAEQRALNRAMFDVSQTPEGKIMLEYLELAYGGRLSVTSGEIVDPNRTLLNAGRQDVYLDIKTRIENGRLAR
jgi:hypothetical protein